MRLRSLLASASPMPPGIGDRCIRHQTRHGECDACIQHCPVAAITLTGNTPRLDADRCIYCSHCVVVCPTDAIDSLSPIERRYEDNCLFSQGDPRVASREELLLWHDQYGIRQIAIPDMASRWLLPVARLNLLLKQIGEPIWQVIYPPETADPPPSRWWAKKTGSVGRIVGGQRALRDAFPAIAWFKVTLDLATCSLCGACGRICPEQAIQFTDKTLQINTQRCTGCRACLSVCFNQSIALQPWAAATSPETHSLHTCRCRQCRQSFRHRSPEEALCPLCRRHAHGMRHAT